MACYFMDAYIWVLVAPYTVFVDVQEIQPWCRILATRRKSLNELSTNGPSLEAGPGVWGRGPEQLVATVPCSVFTVEH